MTLKINNTHLPKCNPPADLGKTQKLSSSLANDTLQGSSQKISKYSSCNWFVDGIKRVFEKFLSFLRCIFCCKCPKKAASDETIASTTNATKPDQSKKQETKTTTFAPIQPESKSTTLQRTATIPRPDEDNKKEEKTAIIDTKPTETTATSEEALSGFEKMPLDIQNIVGEYLEEDDKFKLALASKELSQKTYEKLVKVLETRETLSSNELQILFLKLKKLSEAFSGPVDPNGSYEVVFNHCKNLKKFVFQRLLDEELLTGVAAHLPPQVRVSFVDTKLKDEELILFSKHCPKLKGIDLRASRITVAGLEALAANCKQLEYLDLSFCYGFTDKQLSTILSKWKELKSLSLYMPSHYFNGEELHDLVKQCPQLQALVLGSCPYITDQGLQLLATTCKDLQKLNIEWSQITDQGLQALANNCKKLKELNLGFNSQISSAGLLHLATNCKQLKRLNLGSCNLLNDEGLRLLSASCKQLEKINLSSTSVTDAGLQALAENCPQLQDISVDHRLITTAGLKALFEKCKNLQNVSLSNCQNITDATLQAIAINWKQLKKLNLRSCQITNAGLKVIAAHCKQLQELDISNNDQITDEGIQELAANCKQLRKLNLGWCKEITNASLQALAKHCKQLKEIELTECNKTTHAGIQELTRNLPHLEVIWETGISTS